MSSGVPDVIPFFTAYGVDFAPPMVGTVPFILPIDFIYLLVLASMLLSACVTPVATQSPVPDNGPTQAGSAPTEAPVQIDFAFLSFNKIPEADALASVEEAINAITVPKINATVKLHPYGIPDYFQQVTLTLQSGESLDVYSSLG